MLALILFIYFVTFADKPLTDTPALSERALEQRAKWNIPVDELDYPVSAVYLDSLRHLGVSIQHTSRWFNGATCSMSSTLAEEVAALDFVTDIQMTRDNSAYIYSARKRAPAGPSAIPRPMVNAAGPQLALFNLTPLHQKGFKGQGILMTVCDGGFMHVNTMPCFRDSLYLGHFDFTDDTHDFYDYTGLHGLECLSLISAIQDGYSGAATQASYYLMRSEEYASESPKEMDNLVAALETSDSLGVNVFSVSLGYAMFDNEAWSLNKYTDLDGRSTRSSLAATIAARKGMLVCVAAGNFGDQAWRTIDSPSDADSILTVGAVDVNGRIGSFSSYGPSSDGRIKPEVCAVGVQSALINGSGDISYSYGTSFATPLLAGLAASLWSALPDENAMQIRERIIRSADRYDNPDTTNYRYGYGIPDAWKAYTLDLHESIENTEIQPTSVHKILHNGQIYIIRGNKRYTITGGVL